MIKETDIKKIKETAKVFLRLPVHSVSGLPEEIYVLHPFFESCFIAYKDGKISDIRKEENLKKAYEIWDNHIDKCPKFSNICTLMNKAYRLTFMDYCISYLSKKDFSKALADNWINSENPNKDVNVNRKKFISWFKKADKNCLMSEKEFKIYENIPDTITLYRGIGSKSEKLGLSWTDSYDNALWFANRFGEGYIVSVQAKKEDIFCYFDSRGEDEYVLDVFKYKDKIKKVSLCSKKQEENADFDSPDEELDR